MTEFFCPACDAQLVVATNAVVVTAVKRRGWPPAVIDRRDVLTCPICPLCIEVDWSTGNLITLKGKTIKDLGDPFCPTHDKALPIRNFVKPLCGRKDS